MNQLTFHRGLLYALRLQCDEFEAEASKFHIAYGSALQKASEFDIPFDQDLREEFDPLAAIYPSGEEMLLAAVRDRIISLYGTRAKFVISTHSAVEELYRSSILSRYEDDFHTIAAVFLRALKD